MQKVMMDPEHRLDLVVLFVVVFIKCPSGLISSLCVCCAPILSSRGSWVEVRGQLGRWFSPSALESEESDLG